MLGLPQAWDEPSLVRVQGVEAGEDGADSNVMDATHFGATRKGTEGFVEPLIEFAREIQNFLRVASVIDFNPAAYMHARSSSVAFGPIDWETPGRIDT